MKDDRVYLRHIMDAIERIEEYTEAGAEQFTLTPIVQDAVIRNLEIIGEAVKNLSEGFRHSHPDIEWRRIAGMRDVLIHEYFGVDLQVVWNVVSMRLPTLKQYVTNLLSSALP